MELININPGMKVIKERSKEILTRLLSRHPILNDFKIFSAHSDNPKTNRGIFIDIASRENEQIGVDNYGGIERGYHLLTRYPQSIALGECVEWLTLDSSKYNRIEDSGCYFISISADNFDPELDIFKNFYYSYLKTKNKVEVIDKRYNGSTLVYSLSETPVDDRSVMVMLNGNGIVRNSIYSIDTVAKTITFSNPLPIHVEVKVEYPYVEKVVENIPFERSRWTTFLDGVYVYFSEMPVPGDEVVLILFDQVRPTYHVFTGRSSFNLTLSITTSNKKESDLINDYLWPKLRQEFRTEFENSGWVITSQSFSGFDNTDWEESGYLYTADGDISMTVSIEWCRMVPMIKEFIGYSINRKDW